MGNRHAVTGLSVILIKGGTPKAAPLLRKISREDWVVNWRVTPQSLFSTGKLVIFRRFAWVGSKIPSLTARLLRRLRVKKRFSSARYRLLSQAKLGDKRTVALDVLLFEVVEQAAAGTDHF